MKELLTFGFCNLKTVASTLHGIPGVHAKPDTLSVFCFLLQISSVRDRARICWLSSSTNTEAGADKACGIQILQSVVNTQTHETPRYIAMTVVIATVVIVAHVSQMFQTVPHHLSFRPLIAGRHGRK